MLDNHDERYVKEAIENAWNDLLREDFQLLKNDANERSITHKFAEHLRTQFPTWHIDCEYSRDGIDPKEVQIESRPISSDDDNAETVYPDIIVHERCTTNNLLAIEAKKDNNNSDQEALDDIERDEKKLKAYKKDLGYKFALFLKFSTGDIYEKPPVEEWF